MNHHYSDITGRIAEPPRWFDEHAVPRYEDFSPDIGANIYAAAVVLMEIRCQDCGAPFKVCMSGALPALVEAVRADEIHYGDPPNTGCCPAGSTMNSVPVRVLEFWERHPPRRRPDLERAIRPAWLDDDEGEKW